MATMVHARPAGGTPPGKQRGTGVVSPDKTVASTPPHSPERATDESAMYSNMPAVAARHGIRNTNNGELLAAVDEGAPVPPPVDGATPNEAALAGGSKKGKKSDLLRVNRILCRAPSNESAISDLSASLSPGLPRGSVPKEQGSRTSEGENILASLLNDCGVLPAVNDLLTDAGLGSAAGSNAVPVVAPAATADTPAGSNNSKAKKYEAPAVWGVAPDDDDKSTDPETNSGSKAGAGSPGVGGDESVEYDNVELVLDEEALPPALSKDKGEPAAKGLGKFPKPAGILKNKLSKSLSGRSKTPSPAPATEGSMGVAVVESKTDPRISHTYDVANFENEALSPSPGVPATPEAHRGATPVSVPGAGSRTATPVSPLAMESPSRAASKMADPGTPTRVELALASGAVKNDAEAKRRGLLKGLSIKPKKGAKKSGPLPPPTPEKAAAPVTPATSTPKPTRQNIEDAMKWKETVDKTTGKAYYYHRETKEVKWEKPLGYDEATVIKNIRDNAAGGKAPAQSGKKVADADVNVNKGEKTKSKRGFPGLGKMGAKAKSPKKEAAAKASAAAAVATAATAANAKSEKAAQDLADKHRETSKHWRATEDPATGKTYYYNKKTKEVSWTKPAGMDEGSAKKKEVAEETAAMTSVADKRKKTTWFKQRSGSNKSDKGDAAAAEETPAEGKPAGEADDSAKHWRAAQDPTTGQTYYFHKKTKLVQWTKPEGFVEKGEKKEETAGADGAKEEAKVESEAVEKAGEEAEEEDQIEMEAFTEDEAVDNEAVVAAASSEEAPFDEPDAPFDEPFDQTKTPKPLCFNAAPLPSPKREADDDDDEEERKDSFDEADKAPGAEPLYGRVKSLKSIDFNGRNRTFASHVTDTTRKAANKGPVGPADAGTWGSESLNNSSIASEIFAPFDGDKDGKRKRAKEGRRPQQERQETAARGARERLPQPPSPPRRYNRKQAENLGDSSIEEESYEEMEEQWTDDDVSALSGIGNESLEDKRKRRDRSREKGHPRESRAEKSSSRNHSSRKEETEKASSGDVKEWTQEELDSFIAKNDWQSVSKYINEMRVSKGQHDRLADRKEPSIREIQERIAHNRRVNAKADKPKSKFGSRSQPQLNEQSSEESESVWQSLSSASYEEEASEASSYDRRKGSGRRRSSPREMMM